MAGGTVSAAVDDLTAVEFARIRWAAFDLELALDGDGVWRGPCPVHRTEYHVEVEEGPGLDDAVTIGPCPGGCLPEETIGLLGLGEQAQPPAEWTRARRRINTRRYGSPDGAGSQYLRVLAALQARGFTGRRSDPTGVSGDGRYMCPACGAPGDGHGLRVSIGETQPVVLVCHACRAPTGELLAALGLTWDDIARPLPPPLTFNATAASGERSREEPNGRAVASPDGEPRFRTVTLQQFAAVEEAGGQPLLGDRDQALIPENADVMIYGDGGAGKTTLAIDLAAHWAAGDDWLGIHVSRPLHCLIIEDEGPRPLFRRKIDRKLTGWNGSPLGDRARVLDEPWARFTLAAETQRQELADTIRQHNLDVVILSPLSAPAWKRPAPCRRPASSRSSSPTFAAAPAAR
jgi:AAA domain-containing protein